MLTSCLCENPGTDDEVMRLLSNTRLRQRQEALYRRGAATSNSPFLCVTFDCCENFDPVSFQTTRDRQKFLQRIPTCLGGTEGSFFGSECLSTLSLRSCSHVVVSSNGLMHCFAICRVQGKRQTRRVARMLWSRFFETCFRPKMVGEIPPTNTLFSCTCSLSLFKSKRDTRTSQSGRE